MGGTVIKSLLAKLPSRKVIGLYVGDGEVTNMLACERMVSRSACEAR